MPTSTLLRQRRRRLGFSLTEVAIAIATVSVSLVALLGLVASTLQTGKSTAKEATLTTSSQEALDALRARDFSKLPYVEPTPAKDVSQTGTTPTVLPNIYIAADGQWLAPDRSEWPDASGEADSPPAEAVYKCVVTIEPDAATLTPKTLSNTDTETCVNLLRVQLALSPIIAPATTKPTVLIHATIPRP